CPRTDAVSFGRGFEASFGVCFPCAWLTIAPPLSGDGCTIVHRATTDPLVHAVPGVRPEVVDTTPGRTPVWGDLSLDALGLDLVDDRRVGQGRGVPAFAALGHVLEQATHDLAGPRLGQLGHHRDVARLGDRRDVPGDRGAELVDERAVPLLGVVGALAQDHVGDDRLPRGVVGSAHDRGLGHGVVTHEGRLDLGCGDPVAGAVHDVVDPAEDPQVAVGVPRGAVAGEVVALLGEAGPVGVAVALHIAPDAAEHGGPRLGDHQVALVLRRDLPGVAVDDRDVDARQRAHGGAGLGRGDPGQRGDHDGAGLRLPPGVHDGDGRTADVIAVPAPRLGVDGLADGAEQPDRGQVVPGRDLPAPLHERPDERGRGVVDAHAVLLDDLEVAVLV